MSEALVRPFGKKSRAFILRDPAQDRRYTVLEGAVRSAKTFTMDAKTIVQYSRYEVPGKRFIGGISKDTVHRNMLVDIASIVGQGNFSYNMSSGECWIFDKQYFVVGARDEASYKKILGSTVGLFLGDEIVEFPKSFLAQIWMRMSSDWSRFLGSTNPGSPYCYLKTDVLDQFPADKLEVIHFTLDDNPNITAEAKAAIKASQSGIFYRRYILGLWELAEGSIYRDSWDDQENCFANVERKARVAGRTVTYKGRPVSLLGPGGHTERWYAVDPGVEHPQVVGEFYDDGDTVWLNRTWRWDSRKQMRQLTDAQYADELETWAGGKDWQILVPPEAASFRAELVLRGWWVTDADNSVIEGIHTVSTLLSRRKLLVNVDECNGIEKRIPAYAWDEKAGKRGDEQPLKVEDDDCDMLRYGVHGKVPSYRVRGL